MTPNKLYEDLDAIVSGQDSAKKLVSFYGWLHHLRASKHAISNNLALRMKPVTFMLIGPTGCGKTHLIQSMANLLKLPFMEINCVNLSTPGWHGADFNEYYDTLISKSGNAHSENGLSHTIVLLDEIDKICVGSAESSSNQTQYHLRIQHSLLKLLEGTISVGDRVGMRPTPEIDTKNFMFVFAGSFENIRKKRKEKKHSIGFTYSSSDLEAKELQEELIGEGIIPELAGRISGCAELDPLSDAELRKILTEVDGNVVDLYNEFLADSGIKIRMSEEEILAVLEACKKRKTGARSLRQEFESRIIQPVFDHFEHKKLLED